MGVVPIFLIGKSCILLAEIPRKRSFLLEQRGLATGIPVLEFTSQASVENREFRDGSQRQGNSLNTQATDGIPHLETSLIEQLILVGCLLELT